MIVNVELELSIYMPNDFKEKSKEEQEELIRKRLNLLTVRSIKIK